MCVCVFKYIYLSVCVCSRVRVSILSWVYLSVCTHSYTHDFLKRQGGESASPAFLGRKGPGHDHPRNQRLSSFSFPRPQPAWFRIPEAQAIPEINTYREQITSKSRERDGLQRRASRLQLFKFPKRTKAGPWNAFLDTFLSLFCPAIPRSRNYPQPPPIRYITCCSIPPLPFTLRITIKYFMIYHTSEEGGSSLTSPSPCSYPASPRNPLALFAILRTSLFMYMHIYIFFFFFSL